MRRTIWCGFYFVSCWHFEGKQDCQVSINRWITKTSLLPVEMWATDFLLFATILKFFIRVFLDFNLISFKFWRVFSNLFNLKLMMFYWIVLTPLLVSPMNSRAFLQADELKHFKVRPFRDLCSANVRQCSARSKDQQTVSVYITTNIKQFFFFPACHFSQLLKSKWNTF